MVLPCQRATNGARTQKRGGSTLIPPPHATHDATVTQADALPDEGPDYSSGEESGRAEPLVNGSDDEGEDLQENVEA